MDHQVNPNITNVLVWSHKLHGRAVERIQRLYPEAVFHDILYHCDNRDNVVEDLDHIFHNLITNGALEGRVVMTPPSISTVTALAVIAVYRETGNFPDIVNMLQIYGTHVPSNRVPVFKGQAYGDRRRRLRSAV